MRDAEDVCGDDAWDESGSKIDEVRRLLDDAIIAALHLFEMHPSPATVEPMYQHLRGALISLNDELDKMRTASPPLTTTAAPSSDGRAETGLGLRPKDIAM